MNNSIMLEHYAVITISDNKLEAYLQFGDLDDQFSCTLEQLMELLKRYHIQHGIQYDILQHITQAPKQFLHNKAIIAIGTAPVNGKDGYIRTVYDMAANDKRPVEKIDGKVDFRDLANLRNIRSGQLIAERIPAEEGIHGKAVTGETLFANKGKEVHFKIGKNVVVDNDRMNMYAAIDGMITQTDRDKLNVFPVYEVNGDVDYHTGNIDFVGTVVIRGNVLNGFRVRASGDIRVIGGIEGAELEADGSVEITAGILGHHKGLVKANKNVRSSFIHQGNVQAGEDVIVSQSIMHSNVRAGRSVICQGAKGLIVGGLIQAGEKVEARSVGNSMSTATAIEVGVLPELRNELQQLRIKLRQLIESLDKTDKALALIDQLSASGQLSQDKIALRIKLSHTKRQVMEDQTEIRERIVEIEQLLDDSSNARVEVSGVIFGGCKITLGRYTRFVKEENHRVTFKFVDGDISMVSR